jgi:hypothetical protein
MKAKLVKKARFRGLMYDAGIEIDMTPAEYELMKDFVEVNGVDVIEVEAIEVDVIEVDDHLVEINDVEPSNTEPSNTEPKRWRKK